MATITVKDLVNYSAPKLDLVSFVRDLSGDELAMQGGKKHHRPAPPIAVVPDILIGFSVAFSI